MDIGTLDTQNQVELGPLFSQPWWLDIVAKNRWDEISLIRDKRKIARWPLVFSRSRGGKHIEMPPLTQVLGPSFLCNEVKHFKKLAFEKEVISELIEKLPRYDFLRQNLHHSMTNWLPLYWKGFAQTTRYTYIIKDLSDIDQVWRGFHENTRNVIRKAEKILTVAHGNDSAILLSQLRKTFERQQKSFPVSEGMIEQLVSECLARGQGKIYYASDTGGRVHSAIFVIWDSECAYYLLGGGDPELRSSGANSLLIWRAIQELSGQTQMFDFEGSMIEAIEKFFRGFGAVQTPYFQISRTSRRGQIYSSARELLSALWP